MFSLQHIYNQPCTSAVPPSMLSLQHTVWSMLSLQHMLPWRSPVRLHIPVRHSSQQPAASSQQPAASSQQPAASSCMYNQQLHACTTSPAPQYNHLTSSSSSAFSRSGAHTLLLPAGTGPGAAEQRQPGRSHEARQACLSAIRDSRRAMAATAAAAAQEPPAGRGGLSAAAAAPRRARGGRSLPGCGGHA
jgi:hypothetical protein